MIFLMFLKPLKLLFGLPGALLGASWSLLGRLGTKLGWSWGYFWGTLIYYYFFEWFGEPKGIPKGGHFGSQHGVKIFEKSRCKFKTQKVASWNLLGSIWARFPSRLEVKNIDFSLLFECFREYHNF